VFNITNKYRSFHANNKYNYPGLFAALGISRTLMEFTLALAVAWYGINMLTGQTAKDNPTDTISAAAPENDSADQLPVITGELKEIEVPAVSLASTLQSNGSTPIMSGMRNIEWLLNQSTDLYVVQLGSSTDKASLYQKAFELSDSYPSVVFPFKKTRDGKIMYGYSMGLFENLQDARNSVNKLNANTTQEGIWIRRLSELQKKISRVN